MDSVIKQSRAIILHLTPIDLENIKNGETIKAKVKTSFETEVEYDIEVHRTCEKSKDYK